jgi:hypothetical protein
MASGLAAAASKAGGERMTAFKWALAHVGLTQTEAAALLGKSLKTIDSWSRGRSQGDWTATPTPEAWETLHALARRQRAAAKGPDEAPWPSPGAEAMPAILKWIATGKPPARTKSARREKAA